MLRIFAFLCCIVLLCSSCKTMSLQQESQTNTIQQVVLGSVGLDKDFILQSGFNNTAIPSYSQPIKVLVSVTPFTKRSHKTFLKAKAVQVAKIDVGYTDSLAVKPKYVEIKIIDKVSLLKALNNSNNTSVKEYLSYNVSANIITHVSMALNQHDLNAITNADAVFLVENGLKSYALQLYKDNVKTQVVKFNQGVVFAYKTSNCCWQENTKHQLNIVDLVSPFNSCPNKTYRSANRAKKKINYYKL